MAEVCLRGFAQTAANALDGVRVDYVEVREDGKLVVVFDRGTDIGNGYLVVDSADVYVTDGEAATADGPEAR